MVFPTPFTPTTIITYGLHGNGSPKSITCVLLFSAKSEATSSTKMALSSAVPKYLSRFTRSCIRSMMRNVVSTPTSEVMSASSKLSNTSSSTVDLPAIAWLILLSTDSLLFSRPLSSVSFFSFPNNPKNAIIVLLE